jgi:hypothetical protein
MDEEVQDVQEEVVQPQDEAKAESKTVPYERFSKEVARRKELEEKLASIQPKEEKPELEAQEKPLQFDTLADNLSVLRHLDDDEVTELRTQSKDLGIDPVKFAKSPAWKAHLDTLRTNKKAEETTPEPSRRTAVFNGKTYAEVLKDDSASAEDRQKAYEAHLNSKLKRGRNEMI